MHPIELMTVLFVTDRLHPIDGFAIQRFLNVDVRHSRGRCCSVPMLQARREPDHIARPYFLDEPIFPLNPAEAGGDDQRLAERVRMPSSAGARLERDAGAAG